MKRLTRKKVHIDEIGNRHNYEGNYVYIVEKLGRLEDLEEELGCRLEVVFKALKDGIIYFEDNTYSVDFGLENNSGSWFFTIYDNLTSNKDIIHLKDYQKTWWLKGEKNE